MTNNDVERLATARRLRCYEVASRILPDHTIIQRPDCARRCEEQTALCIMIAHLKLDDRLAVLRAGDRFRTWQSLDDERTCIICKRKFNGRQVEIRRLTNSRHELRCPTDHCNSQPHLWIYPKTPLVSHVVRLDWWRPVDKKQERRAFALASGAQGHRV